MKTSQKKSQKSFDQNKQIKQNLPGDPMQAAQKLSHFTAAKTDPQGSWTGRPLDPFEKPIQDADDL